MGQYIQIGVCTEVRVAKAHLERSKLSLVELREALQEELGLHLFDEEETEAEHVWRIKERLLTQGFADFLRHQRAMTREESRPEAEAFLVALEACQSAAEVHALTNSEACPEAFVLWPGHTREILGVGPWKRRVAADLSVLIYLLEGKVFMECYRKFFRYLRSALAYQKIENPIVEAVWVTVG
jgi:hypothetical protein